MESNLKVRIQTQEPAVISQPSVSFGEIASVEEVARYYKVSTPTIRKRIESGLLPAINFGTEGRKMWRIRWAEVQRSQQ